MQLGLLMGHKILQLEAQRSTNTNDPHLFNFIILIRTNHLNRAKESLLK